MTEPIWRDDIHEALIPELVRVTHATGVFSPTEIGWVGELAHAALAQGNSASGYHFLYAEDRGRLLGFTCFGPIEGTANRFDLYWIVVDPEAQGSGLGHALLARTIASAKAQGATHLFIETSTRPDYAPARALYRKLGFSLQGMLEDFYADGDSKAIFGRAL